MGAGVGPGGAQREARPRLPWGSMDDAVQGAPALSVVVPAYGAPDLLDRCLGAVARELAAARAALRAEIVVVDDATPGGLPPALRRRHPGVRRVRAERNLGFAGSATRGVEAARVDVVCPLNGDMNVGPGWFDDCLALFDDPAVFAVSGRIREPTGRNDGYKELWLDGATVDVRTHPDGHPLCDAPAPIPYASGGGSFFRRAAFAELGARDLRVRVAGPGPEDFRGPLDERGLADAVRLEGWMSDADLDRMVAGCRLLAYPAIDEPFGLVSDHAMAHGRAALASRTGGPAETVLDGVTGVHVDPLDPPAVARRLVALWSDPAACDALGAAGRERYRAHLTFDHFLDRFERAVFGAGGRP